MLTKRRIISLVALATLAAAVVVALWFSLPMLFNQEADRANPVAQPGPSATPNPTTEPALLSEAERAAKIREAVQAQPTPSPTPDQSVEPDTLSDAERAAKIREAVQAQPTPSPTPDQSIEPDTLSDAERAAKIREAVQAQADQRNPQIMTLEEAREVVPFQILTPEYLPEGYEPEEFVAVKKGPESGGREALSKPFVVKGVSINYLKVVGPSGSRRESISIEQEVGGRPPGSVGGAEKASVEDIGGLSADVWKGEMMTGAALVAVFWVDPSRGVGTSIASGASVEETLRVARSFR